MVWQRISLLTSIHDFTLRCGGVVIGTPLNEISVNLNPSDVLVALE